MLFIAQTKILWTGSNYALFGDQISVQLSERGNLLATSPGCLLIKLIIFMKPCKENVSLKRILIKMDLNY